MLYEIWIIERNKVDILTLYSFLNFEEIKEVYDACDKYMSSLNRGSILKDLQIDNSQAEDQEMGVSATPDGPQGASNINNNAAEYSDEEREAEMYRSYMQKKRKQNKNAK